MPFWLHDPSFLYKARSYSSFQRIIISSLFLGIISIGWYGALHYFIIKHHAQETIKHESMMREIQSLSAFLSHQKTTSSPQSALKHITISSYQQHDIITSLISTMKKHRIACVSLVPYEIEATNTLFKQFSLKLNAHACFDDLLLLLKDISNADHLIELCDVLITRRKKNNLELIAEIKTYTLPL